jgi:RNA polymerase sigma-70 factor (ECF subfamily)
MSVRADDATRARSRERAAWMARVQAGDRDAYRALLEDVGPLLLGWLRRWLAKAPDLADIYQDTLVHLHRARHTYDPARPFEPWLFAIARNSAADHARRHRLRRAFELLVDDMPDVPAEDEAPTRALIEALDALPRPQREAFVLLKLEGLSVGAAAARAGVTPGALKVRAHRAYKALKTRLGS